MVNSIKSITKFLATNLFLIVRNLIPTKTSEPTRQQIADQISEQLSQVTNDLMNEGYDFLFVIENRSFVIVGGNPHSLADYDISRNIYIPIKNLSATMLQLREYVSEHFQKPDLLISPFAPDTELNIDLTIDDDYSTGDDDDATTV